MKTILHVSLAVIVLTTGHEILRADAGYSFSFSAAQKKGGGTKMQNDDESVKNQKWSYLVTMENKSFKDVSDMEIKYVMFSKQGTFTQTTGHPNLQRHEGTISIKLLKNNDTITFSTDPVMLKTIDYYDGWYADERATGALRGLWLRVYIGGQMVSEFMDPPDLSNRATFDPPPKDN